jgi:hypothetical protein
LLRKKLSIHTSAPLEILLKDREEETRKEMGEKDVQCVNTRDKTNCWAVHVGMLQKRDRAVVKLTYTPSVTIKLTFRTR